MRKFIFTLCFGLLVVFSAKAQVSAGDLLKGLTGSKDGGSVVNGLSGVVSAITGSSSVKAEDLVGTWTYTQPAVSFQSDNLLKKAGGAAASATIVNKLTPYYTKFGVKGTTVTFTKDGAFTIAKGKLKVQGTYTASSDGSKYVFSIKALGSIPAGKLTVYITGNSSKIQLTAAADKLLAFVAKVGSLTGNSTIKGLSSIAGGYDGLNIGMELTKSSK